mmetsp:Transcript_39204/g.117890  ORF Transcript_39204/g.117890 Transcript_39204/m.117890 type:complete len:100 (-) Transcript_39204:99-398(-)
MEMGWVVQKGDSDHRTPLWQEIDTTGSAVQSLDVAEPTVPLQDVEVAVANEWLRSRRAVDTPVLVPSWTVAPGMIQITVLDWAKKMGEYLCVLRLLWPP